MTLDDRRHDTDAQDGTIWLPCQHCGFTVQRVDDRWVTPHGVMWCFSNETGRLHEPDAVELEQLAPTWAEQGSDRTSDDIQEK